jgi:hypothetical protein
MSDTLRGWLKSSMNRATPDSVRIALVAATVVVGVIQSPRLSAQVTSGKPTVDESQRNQQPAFDVASVKPNKNVDARRGGSFAPGRFSQTAVTLRQIIQMAGYGRRGALPVVGAAGVLIGAAVVASLIPAARAANVDVLQALRSE